MHPSFGILAGMGPRSTAPFIDLVVSECQRQYGARHDIDFPRMMICSHPAPFYEDRPIDHAALESAILDGLQHLERTGVDFLAIACNTAHIYFPRLASAVSVPLLNMVELTLDAVPRSARTVALIAARPTVESEIYQVGLRSRGWKVADTGDVQAQVDQLLTATRTSTDAALFIRLWQAIFERARVAGADTVVVACLDLSGLLAHAPQTLSMVDAAQCLAREIVKQWLIRREFHARRMTSLPIAPLSLDGPSAAVQ